MVGGRERVVFESGGWYVVDFSGLREKGSFLWRFFFLYGCFLVLYTVGFRKFLLDGILT